MKAYRGLNLAPLAYYTPSPFADMMKVADWINPLATAGNLKNPQNTPVPDVDAQGWPIGLNAGQSVLVLVQQQDSCPNGDYTVIADGVGTIAFSWPDAVTGKGVSAVLRFDGTPAKRAQKVNCPTVKPMGSFSVTIRASDANNHLRNIQVYRPGYVEGDLFRTDFVESLRWANCIRFLNWMKIVGNTGVVDWSDRTTTQYTAMAPAGVPYELMFQLVNRLGSAAWIHVPQDATDDFVTRLALLANEKMDHRHTLYLELSDEYWNAAGLYPWHDYSDKGLKEGLSTNANTAALMWGGRRAAQCARIFKQNYGGKLCCVLSGQSTVVSSLTIQLKYLDSLGMTKYIDGLATAPYFMAKTVTDDDIMANWATDPKGVTDRIFASCRDYLSTKILPSARSFRDVCGQYRKKMLAYECGQSLVPTGKNQNNPDLSAAYQAANHDWRMVPLYWDYVKMLQDNGYELLNFYSHCASDTKFGSWGMLNYLGQPIGQVPKWRAVAAAIYPPHVQVMERA